MFWPLDSLSNHVDNGYNNSHHASRRFFRRCAPWWLFFFKAIQHFILNSIQNPEYLPLCSIIRWQSKLQSSRGLTTGSIKSEVNAKFEMREWLPRSSRGRTNFVGKTTLYGGVILPSSGRTMEFKKALRIVLRVKSEDDNCGASFGLGKHFFSTWQYKPSPSMATGSQNVGSRYASTGFDWCGVTQ
jgi:hypothetical protein